MSSITRSAPPEPTETPAAPFRAGQARLAGLDHLRAFAIFFVFLSHYPIFAKQPVILVLGSHGWSGVDLFFVLSGYLIGSQLFARHAAGRPMSMVEFYGKRFLRTLPPYFVVLALYYLWPAFVERGALPPLWKFLTFTQNLSMVLWAQTAFSHAWSLCVEEHFYLLLPLCCWVLLRPGRGRASVWVAGGLFAAGAVLRAFLWLGPVAAAIDPANPGSERTVWYRLIYYPTWSRLDGLIVGVLIAALSVYRPASLARLLVQADKLFAAGVIVLLAAGWLCVEQDTFAATVLGFPAFSLGYGLLVLSALSPNGLLERFDSRITRFVAASSYSLYLTHKSIIKLTLGALDGHLDRTGLPAFFACLFTALLAGAAMHFAIERPALRLRDKWLRRRRQAGYGGFGGAIESGQGGAARLPATGAGSQSV